MSYPDTVDVLREFGLITDEQADSAIDIFWDEMETLNWWDRLAWLAWHNEVPWWRQVLGWPNWEWRRRWVDQHRVGT